MSLCETHINMFFKIAWHNLFSNLQRFFHNEIDKHLVNLNNYHHCMKSSTDAISGRTNYNFTATVALFLRYLSHLHLIFSYNFCLGG